MPISSITGYAYLELGDMDKALIDINESIVINPENPERIGIKEYITIKQAVQVTPSDF